MTFTPADLNKFLLFKLPAAFICGVRVKSINATECTVSVKHRWINQNPFKSMYFAVQAMAAELSTGALVMLAIKNSGKPISMLIAGNSCTFSKKATGRIFFKCADGALITDAIANCLATGEGQAFTMKSIGINEQGQQVSEFHFEWTVKAR